MDRIHDVDHLLQTGIDLMVVSGYHNTSINAVIRKAGLPKGSFYHLYKDKKAFALDAVKRHGKYLCDGMDEVFSNASYSPLEAIRQYYLKSIQVLGEAGYGQGCFLGNMGQEMSDVDEDFRLVIQTAFNRLHAKLNAQLLKAKEAGEIGSDRNTEVLADLIINTWHGSLLRMKASRSKNQLDIFVNDFFDVIACNV